MLPAADELLFAAAVVSAAASSAKAEIVVNAARADTETAAARDEKSFFNFMIFSILSIARF